MSEEKSSRTTLGKKCSALLEPFMPLRVLFLFAAYLCALYLSLWFAYLLRFDFEIPERHLSDFQSMVLWILPYKLCFLFAFGQFSILLTYFRLPDLFRIIRAMGFASLFLVLLWFGFLGEGLPPRAVILADCILSIVFLAHIRLGMRLARERFLSEPVIKGKETLALIIGTGETAESLVSDLLAKPGLRVRPVAFLDWDAHRKGKYIHGIPILGTPEDLLAIAKRYHVDKVILALRPSERGRTRDVIQQARDAQLTVEMVPSLQEIATGRVQATHLRPVELEDLLGRPPVSLDSEKIHQLVTQRIVCVTGAGGSIGRELSRQIAKNQPSRLILIDHSETDLFEIEQELIQRGHGTIIVPCVADIGDSAKMVRLFREFRPTLLFHAAAYKHVPMMEHQPEVALRNNSLATFNLAEAACTNGVERFVFISTDKAINPTSVMGASKRLAELLLQSFGNKPGNTCSFVAVRFGNVLGSSGSVIPTFKKQIAAGGPVTVTHPEVTRYFMTIPEAVGLVLQSAVIGKGSDILVLDMGEPMKIVDIARQLIRLSGFEPDNEIKIEFVGLRPGEKLFEELQHQGESFEKTEHPAVVRFKSTPTDYAGGLKLLDALEQALKGNPTSKELKAFIQSHIQEYQPYA